MLERDYFQKLDSLNNEMDILSEKIKQVSKELSKLYNMIECPRCYNLFQSNEMNGGLCNECVEFLDKENIK